MSLLLPCVATALVWIVARQLSATYIAGFLAAGLIPYAPFVLLFLAATLNLSEPELRRAILWAPIAFAPFLFLFILVPAMLFPDPIGPSAVLAAGLAIAFGYAYVGFALLLYRVLRRAGWIAQQHRLPDAS
jgi:hypothetical protein